MAFDAGSAVGRMELALAGWSKSVETIKKDQTELAGFALRHKEAIQDLGKQFTIAGAAITGALGLMVKKTADMGDELNDMAQRTGVSVVTLSSFKLAADKSGTSIEGVATGLKFLSAQMVTTSQATDKSKTLLGALGVSATDAGGNLRNTGDVMLDVADVFASMTDGALKTNLAVDLFGRSGMELIPMLNMGKKGLEENVEAAKKLGITFTKDGAKACDDFNDSLTELKAAGLGVIKLIGESLMPTIKELVGNVTKAVSGFRGWAAEHPNLARAVTSLSFALGAMLTVVGSIAFILPTLIIKLQTLATVLGITKIATAGWGAAVGGVVGAAVAYLAWCNKLTEAHNAEVAALKLAASENQKYQNVYYQLIMATGATKVGFMELATSYHGSYLELLRNIEAGKLGIPLQKALAATGIDLASAEDRAGNAAKEQERKMRALLESLTKTEDAAKKLKDELNITFASDLYAKIAKIDKALELFKDDLTASEVAKLRQEAARLADELQTGGIAFDFLAQRGKASLEILYFAMRDEVDPAFESVNGMADALVATMKYRMPDAFGNTAIFSKRATTSMMNDAAQWADQWRRLGEEVARSVSQSLLDLLGVTKLFSNKMKEFNESYYKRAFDELKADYDARIDSINKQIEANNKYYETAKDNLDKEKERRRREIEDTITDSKEKALALRELDDWYASESDKLRKEKETKEEQLKNSLAYLEDKYQKEVERIRADQEKKQDEYRKRQEEKDTSLWGRLKTAFGTAIDGMLTLWISRFIGPLLESISKSLLPKITDIGKGADGAMDTAGKAAGGLGKTIGGIFTTIGTIITTLATAVATAIGTIATGIGSALVGIATAVASACTILAAAAEAIVVVGALAVALFAAFKIVGGIVDAIFGGGGDGGENDIRNWLRLTHDLTKEIHDWVHELWSFLLSEFWDVTQHMRDFLDIGVQLARDQISILENIRTNTQETANALAGLPSYDSGSTYVPKTQIALIHQGERIYNPANGGGALAAAGDAGAINVGPLYFGSIASDMDVRKIGRSLGESIKRAVRAGRR